MHPTHMMMKQPYDKPKSLTDLTHQVEDQKDYPNYHQSDYPKNLTDPQEDSQEEDSLEAEDSLEGEYQEEEEDIPEEAHQEQDHQVEDGDPCLSQCPNRKEESW